MLSIAKKQNQVLLTGDGLAVANAIDDGLEVAYPFDSKVFGDGISGKEGALVVLRENQDTAHQTLVFKATSQGLGHGHFDKLHWIFYNQGEEIVYDYGAARFLNVEAKYGGHYLPENNAYAKQTIAHNTLVVDEISHFNGKTSVGNQYHPDVLFTEFDEELQISSARMENAYDNLAFTRTQALVNSKEGFVFLIDILDVEAEGEHQLDVPVHFNGQFIDSNVGLQSETQSQSALGSNNGYQYLWLQGKGEVEQDLARVTWLKDNTFYTHTTVAKKQHNSKPQELLMVRIGANDSNFNLIAKQALINRVHSSGNHQFLSMLEVHGEYNGSREFTINSKSQLQNLENISHLSSNKTVSLVKATFAPEITFIIAIASGVSDENTVTEFSFEGKEYEMKGNAHLFPL